MSSSLTSATISPGLAEWSYFDVERPGAPILMRDVPDFLGDCGWSDKELAGSVGKALSRPFQVDDRVDKHIGNVHALGSQLTGDRFREYSLRGLGRREPGKAGLA